MAAKELPQHQQQPLKTLYELGKNAHFHEVYIHKLGQQLGLGTVQYQSGRDKLARLARELEEAGYVRRRAGRYIFFFERSSGRRQSESQLEGFGYLSLTDEGHRIVEENLS
jgi:hypothetical protein